MNTVPFPPASPWFPILPPELPPSSAFWETTNVHSWLTELQSTLNFAKAMEKELELLFRLQDPVDSIDNEDCKCTETSVSEYHESQEDRNIRLSSQESLLVEASNSVICKLRAQLEPFRVITNENTPWEEKSAAVRLANKMHKSRRNKLWRKRKRRRIAEMNAKEHEQFDRIDQEADEWRVKEIAKDIAKRKVEEMKVIAKAKAKKEGKALESELELILVVEKLQELRAIRIQKLKKQGHFLPDEDDRFLEGVRAAVEEEERQADGTAASTEECKKMIREEKNQNQMSKNQDPQTLGLERRGYDGVDGCAGGLPPEFYHYYHGSNTDMGSLIEVRNQWDAYIRPGGSRIPGHWVQPPPPADETWASYLVPPN